jgi:hypothetical protein
MDDTVLEQDTTFAGAEARGQSGASPIVTPGQTGGVPITEIQSGTSGVSAPATGGIATLTSPLTAKGDIFVRDATKGTRQAVGADQARLVADSSKTTGLDYIAASTGWGAASGTLSRGAYASYAGQVVSNPPTQAETQALDDAVKLLSKTVAALITDLTTQKLLNV